MQQRRYDLVVVGMGYVGLPLAAAALRRGLRVAGLERSNEVVEELDRGVSRIDDVADADVEAMIAGGFKATTDPAVLSDTSAIVICVPTPLTESGEPDLDSVRAASQAVGTQLQPETLVVLESTTYPGTTDDVVRPILESASGLIAGEGFYLAYSPERVDPGNTQYNIANTPKVVGGHTDECTDRATDLYERFIDHVVVTVGTREAELAKLLENTYRHVNIALVNELAIYAHELGIDLWAAIEAASTKPFGFEPFYPGPGVGGHCIPIDPSYLSYSVRTLGHQFRFVELAREISAGMPGYVVRRIQRLLNDDGKPVRGTRICLLGVAFKANVSDSRETPALPIAEQLLDLGADVSYMDPHVPAFSASDQDLERVDSLESLASTELAVLLQGHRAFIADQKWVDDVPLVLDTRGLLSGAAVTRL